jgi:hypothetical protein
MMSKGVTLAITAALPRRGDHALNLVRSKVLRERSSTFLRRPPRDFKHLGERIGMTAAIVVRLS